MSIRSKASTDALLLQQPPDAMAFVMWLSELSSITLLVAARTKDAERQEYWTVLSQRCFLWCIDIAAPVQLARACLNKSHLRRICTTTVETSMYWRVFESVLSDAAFKRSLRLRAAVVTRFNVWATHTMMLWFFMMSEMKRHYTTSGKRLQLSGFWVSSTVPGNTFNYSLPNRLAALSAVQGSQLTSVKQCPMIASALCWKNVPAVQLDCPALNELINFVTFPTTAEQSPPTA